MDRYNLKSKVACVIDSGGYPEIAIELAKAFGKVYYFVEWREAFPTYHKKSIGTGIPNVIRIENLEDYEDEIDFWYVTDLFYGAKTEQLRRNGKICFGAGRGEIIELNRGYLKGLLKQLDLPVNEYETIIGITALREYLKANPDVYVKLNANMRGHLESSHCENYDLFKPVLDSLQHQLGWDAETAEFMVEKPIRPAIEYGYDGYFCSGGYPNKTTFGVEIKDSAYGCIVVDYNKLPKSVKEINEKFKPILTAFDYRGALGNEIRHQEKGKAYYLDAYCRQGQPPTSLQIRMTENYAEVAYEIALGRIPDIKFKAKYGVMLVIKSDWAKTEPQPIYFDEKYAEFISIKNLAIKDGIRYFVPTIGCEMEEIGSCAFYADTMKAAIKQVKEIAKSIKGYGVHVNVDALDETQEEIDKLSKYGINLF